MAAVPTTFALTKSASSINKVDHSLVKIKPYNFSLNLNRQGTMQTSLTRRPLTIQATYSDGGRPSSASVFVGGFLLGGLIVGTLGCVYAPQISKALAGADRKELMRKLPKFIYDEEKALESKSPFWYVPLGPREDTTASESEANNLSSPFEPIENIIANFISKGLEKKDVAVLSGAHTLDFAQCFTFKPRLLDFGGSGKSDPSLDVSLLHNLVKLCPNQADSDTNLAPLDPVTDNMYYKNIVNNSGLLQSDQALLGDSRIASLVNVYSKWPIVFFIDFAVSMEKMGRIGVLTGSRGQIRTNCRAVN